ncbi:MAG: thioredoxin family protein [Chitinophagaceae bacterium]
MKRQIEIFTAGCPVCESTVKLVKDLACENCEITVYDLVKQCEDKTCLRKIKEYGVQSVPAVAVNGKLLSSSKTKGIFQEALIEAGIVQG